MGVFSLPLGQWDVLSIDRKFCLYEFSKNWNFGHNQCASFGACHSAKEMEWMCQMLVSLQSETVTRPLEPGEAQPVIDGARVDETGSKVTAWIVMAPKGTIKQIQQWKAGNGNQDSSGHEGMSLYKAKTQSAVCIKTVCVFVQLATWCSRLESAYQTHLVFRIRVSTRCQASAAE